MTDILKNTNLEPNKVVIVQEIEHVPIEYKEPNQYEIDMIKYTLSPCELLEMEKHETIPVVKNFQDYTDENYKKDLLTKVKVIALQECGFFPLINPSTLDDYDKDRVKEKMEEILELGFSEIDITEKFEKICIKRIFSNKDYYQYWVQRPI